MEVTDRLFNLWSPTYLVMVYLAALLLMIGQSGACAVLLAVVGGTVLAIRSFILLVARSLARPESD